MQTFSQSVSTHSEHISDSVLFAQNESAAIPEGQSVGQVDHEEAETHGNVSRDRLLYSHPLSILQVLMISGVQQKRKNKVMSTFTVQQKLD